MKRLLVLCACALAAVAEPGEPTRDGVLARLASVDAECEGLRRAGDPAAARRFGDAARRLRRELSGKDAPDLGQRHPVCVLVAHPDVKAPGQLRVVVSGGMTVHLALVGAKATPWRVAAVEDARIDSVRRGINQVVSGVPTSRLHVLKERDAKSACAALIGLHDEITTVQLARLDEPTVIGDAAWHLARLDRAAQRLLWNAERPRRARVRAALRALRFDGVYLYGDYGVAFGTFGVGGPFLAEQKRIRISLSVVHGARGSKESVFLTVPRLMVVRHDCAANESSGLRVPDTMPPLRGVGGMVLDGKRRRLLVAGAEFPAYLYAYDLDGGGWQLVHDMGDVEPVALAYDGDERLYALERGARDVLTMHVFTAGGRWLRSTPLDIRTEAPVQAAFAAGHVVVVETLRRGSPRMFVVAPATGRVRLHAPQRFHWSGDPLDTVALERLWHALLAAKTFRTERRLLDGVDETVAFLRARLLAPPPEAAVIHGAIQALGANDPARRAAAQRRLAAFGASARDALDAAATATIDPELRRAARVLLDMTANAERNARRVNRAIRVLGQIDTPAALRLLDDLARAPDLPLAEIRRALARMREPR